MEEEKQQIDNKFMSDISRLKETMDEQVNLLLR